MLRSVFIFISLVVMSHAVMAEGFIQKIEISNKTSQLSVELMTKVCDFNIEESQVLYKEGMENQPNNRYMVFEGKTKEALIASKASAIECLMAAYAELGRAE